MDWLKNVSCWPHAQMTHMCYISINYFVHVELTYVILTLLGKGELVYSWSKNYPFIIQYANDVGWKHAVETSFYMELVLGYMEKKGYHEA